MQGKLQEIRRRCYAAVPAGDADFEAEIAPYRSAKGTLKFPSGKPLPYELIEKTAVLLAAERRGQ